MAVNWLRKLANQSPVPVFPVVGRSGEAALEALYLSPKVTVAQSPKHARTPKLAKLTTLAAFASLGLPGLAGFVAEFHIFFGTFGVYPWLAAIALLGLLITAALFLRMLQSLFFGPLPERWKTMPDLSATEFTVLGILLLLVVVIGVYPAVLIDLIETSTGWLVGAADASR